MYVYIRLYWRKGVLSDKLFSLCWWCKVCLIVFCNIKCLRWWFRRGQMILEIIPLIISIYGKCYGHSKCKRLDYLCRIFVSFECFFLYCYHTIYVFVQLGETKRAIWLWAQNMRWVKSPFEIWGSFVFIHVHWLNLNLFWTKSTDHVDHPKMAPEYGYGQSTCQNPMAELC